MAPSYFRRRHRLRVRPGGRPRLSSTTGQVSRQLSLHKGHLFDILSVMSGNMAAVVPEVVGEAMARALPTPTPRRTKLAAVPGKIDAVIGMRRSGKTWLLFQHAHDLMRAGVPRHRILYLNFE